MSNLVKFNINDYVLVKLTPLGRVIHKANHIELFENAKFRPDYTPPKEDADGWSKWQMHDLMSQFGHQLQLGFDIPFETTIQIEVKP